MTAKGKFRKPTRNEGVLIAAKGLASVGTEAAYFLGVTGYAAYTLEASAALIAAIMFMLNAAHMVGSLLGGILIDRVGPRRVLLGGLTALVGVSIAAQFVGKNVPLFMLFAAAVGFIMAVAFAGFESFVRYIHDERDGLARLHSLLKIATYAAVIVGPAIGAVVVRHYPIERVFFITAAFSILAMVAVYFAAEEKSVAGRGGSAVAPPTADTPTDGRAPAEPEKRHPIWEAIEGGRLLFTMPSLRLYLILGSMMWFAFGAFDALESLYYKDVVGVGIEWMGWVNAAIGFGLLLGAVALTRIPVRFISTTMLAWFVIFEGLFSALYVGTHNIWFVMLGGFLLGIAFGLAEPLLPTLVQSDAPFEAVGRVQGAMNFFRVGATLIPLAVAPGLSEVFGVQGVLVGASLLTTVLIVFLLGPARRLDAAQKSVRKIVELDPAFDD